MFQVCIKDVSRIFQSVLKAFTELRYGVPTSCISSIGTVPTLCISNIGIAPMLYFSNVGTFPEMLILREQSLYI